MIDLSSPQFQDALEKARTQWLKQLLRDFLPQLIPLGSSKQDLEKAKQFDAAIKDRFVERGLISPSQQKNRLTDVRNAIKVFDPNHPSLDIIGLSCEQWIEINSVAAFNTTNRPTQFLDRPKAIAQTALDLLHSDNWSDLAAGLAVVTGRRISEVLKTARFELVSTYSVMFTGAAKRRDESIPLQFEIPTLVEAKEVINAIARLRSLLDTQGLSNRQINDKYEQTVARACDRHFRDLVPVRDGKSNLYSHLFRAVYATIASHWFCPPSVSDLEFRAYIQGHFKILDEKNPHKQTDMASSRHYWDYKISDGRGNVDGRLGIRLADDGVQVIKAFAPKPQDKTTTDNLGRTVKITVNERDRQLLAQIQDRFHLETRKDANHFVLGLAKAVIDAADKLDVSPQVFIERFDGFEDSPVTSESISVFAPDSTTEMEETEDNLTLDNSDSTVTEETVSSSEFLVPSQILFEKMDKQLDQMNLQQQSLDNLTRAICDLVRVMGDNSSPISPVKVSSPQQKSEPASDISPLHSLLKQTEVKPDQLKPKTVHNKPSSEVSQRKRHSMMTRQRVSQYIDAIMAFNDTLDRPHGEKWAISVASLKRLAGCGQHPVYAVIDARQSEIDTHHQKHQLTPTHNKKDHSFPSIESVIKI